jgi:Flp pilus assembly protein TadD
MGVYELYVEGRSHLAAGEYLAAIPPLAIAYLRARRYRDALPEAEAAVECSPNDHYAYFLHGRALQGLGDLTAARGQFRLATWLRPGDQAYQSALESVDLHA